MADTAAAPRTAASKAETTRVLIASPDYAYSRAGTGIFRGGSHIYHRAAASPTGVLCVDFAEDAVHDPILRELRNTSALSPTEGLPQ